jgi:phosphopantothenoylcysteine synthetase/decarboxylase
MEERHPLGGKCNILLGVTGSVAAVKVPELISQLLDTFGSTIAIKVVLTQGGKNFWEKASTYDAVHWSKIQHLLERESTSRNSDEAMSNSKIQIYCKYSVHLNGLR